MIMPMHIMMIIRLVAATAGNVARLMFMMRLMAMRMIMRMVINFLINDSIMMRVRCLLFCDYYH